METGGVGGGDWRHLPQGYLINDRFLSYAWRLKDWNRKEINQPACPPPVTPQAPDIHLVYITSPTLESGFSLRTGETFLKSSASLIQGSVEAS